MIVQVASSSVEPSTWVATGWFALAVPDGEAEDQRTDQHEADRS